MAFYVVNMDLCTQQWQEAKCVIKAKSFEEAINKAKDFNFEDIDLDKPYDMSVVDYDKDEGITIENILGGKNVYRETN